MNGDSVELEAKLKLDTSEATRQIKELGDAADRAGRSAEGIKLPEEVTGGLKELFSGTSGLGNLGRVARGAIGGIRGLTGALQGIAGIATKAGGIIAIVSVLVLLFTKLMQGTDNWQAMSEAISEITDIARDALGPTIAEVGEIVITLAHMLGMILGPLLELVNSVLVPVLTVVNGLLQMLEPLVEIAMELTALLFDVVGVLAEIQQGFMGSLLEGLITLVNAVLKPVISLIQKLREGLQKLKTILQDFVTMITFGLVQFDQAPLTSTSGKVVEDTDKDTGVKTSLDKWETSGQETPEQKSARLAAQAAEGIETAMGNVLSSLFDISASIREQLGMTDKVVQLMDWTSELVEDIVGPEVPAQPTIDPVVDQLFQRIGLKTPTFGTQISPTLTSAVRDVDSALSGIQAAMFSNMSSQNFLGTNQLSISIREGAPAGQRELAQWLAPALKFELGR